MQKIIAFFFSPDGLGAVLIICLVLAFLGCIANPLFLLIAVVLAFLSPCLLLIGMVIEANNPDIYNH